ncbi:FAD:protein FMN transferase [Ralstonia mannitolilytica]|nr:thiamine biosynthesis protein ApbE [Ralstonia mannitolilytica]MBU9580836.1 FAD:protein FMN transferase [Ralstonia mannitolilytica]
MIRRAKPLLGTVVEVRIDDAHPPTDGAHERALATAFDVIGRVDALMSVHRVDSDLSRLHAAPPGDAVSVHPWTVRVLREAQRMHAITGGLFDPTVARLLVEHRLLPRPPGPEAEPDARLSDVVFAGPTTIVKKRPVWLDFGGIAKGFAVDMAVLALRHAGVRNGVVCAGGDLRVFGCNEQPIHVRCPDAPNQIRLIGMLGRGAAASSGNYFAESFDRPAHVSAIQSPLASARPEGAQPGVTCIAPRCIWADALTKVVTLAGNKSPAAQRALLAYHAYAIAS